MQSNTKILRSIDAGELQNVINDKQRYNFEHVTLLVTHFNRSNSFSRLLAAFKNLNINFGEVIVSDGGSKREHLDKVLRLQTEYKFKLLTTPINYGLGHTINRGQNNVNTPYILYVQEDFIPKEAFVKALTEGLSIMQQEGQWDIVRFYSFPWAKFPYLKPYKNGFSEMIFNLSPFYSNHLKLFVYSDHPHLKRISFSRKFGPYLEHINGDVTEMSMCRSFLKKNGKGLYFEKYTELFDHVNSAEEPGLFRPEKERYRRYADHWILYGLYLKFKTLKETLLYLFNS